MAKPTDYQTGRRLQLKLHDLDPQQAPPELAVRLVDRAGSVLHTAPVDAQGTVELPEQLLGEAQSVRIGPAAAEGEEAAESHFVGFRAARFQELAARGAIDISRRDWLRWYRLQTCVEGTVRHCYPFPWLIETLVQSALPRFAAGSRVRKASLERVGLETASFARPSIVPRWRCHLICDGLVQVYRRTCCHQPWVFDDSRFADLLRELEVEVQWPPPPPGPDPDPRWRTERLFKEGALDQRALHLAEDVQALRSLDRFERTAYLEARPYLWQYTICGPVAKVAEGFIQDGGDFHVCWPEWGRWLPHNCYDQYAYKVRQVINGTWVTIYNGVAAGEWFNQNADANLVSYHSAALACRDRSGGPGCYLEEIGTTGAHLLNTPHPNGELSVPGPLADTLDWGLAFPGPAGPDTNRNWGGDLSLYFHFGDEMKVANVAGGADGAVYYRVSVRRAADDGTPTGAPVYFTEGLEWKYDAGAGNILVKNLGPNPVNGENNLYLIPYHDGEFDWIDPHQSFHAVIRTGDAARFTDGRYLVTLEVFNSDGQRLKPVGAVGGGLETSFTYERRIAESGLGSKVPVNFAALTNLFWWDNRKAVGDICELRVGAAVSTEECQFLCGTADSEFGVNYIAYYPLAKFQRNHSLVVTRGLSGSTVAVLANAPSPDGNVGVGGCPGGQSGSARFDCLLRALPSPATPPCTVAYPKCVFTVNLDVVTKTWNGSAHLTDRDVLDRQASFALDTTCP